MGKRYIPPLQTGRICLRLLEEQDLPRTLAWRNQDHIRRWFFFSERLTPEQHAGWFARYNQRDDDFVFIIEELSGNFPSSCENEEVQANARPSTQYSVLSTMPCDKSRPIGQVAIYNIDWASGTAEFGRLMIGENGAAGRGLARAATDAVVTLAFEQLGLQEIYLEVVPGNVRAIKVYEACGFEVTGSTEKAVLMGKRATARAIDHGYMVPGVACGVGSE